jgi:hypothetical protein
MGAYEGPFRIPRVIAPSTYESGRKGSRRFLSVVDLQHLDIIV